MRSTNPSLAQEHLRRLGVGSTPDGSYAEEDAVRVLQGRAIDPLVADTVHSKLAWVVGVQLVDFLSTKFPGLQWTSGRVVVRTLLDGESSASFLSFQDGSHAVLVSRALQESLICMANMLEYFDVSTGLARRSFRRRKRERLSFESTARITGILRYLLLGHRMTGKALQAPAILDSRSFDIAGKMAAGAVMFVVAHEIAHIVHNHETASTKPYGVDGKVAVSEVQELQADRWALNCLTELMADDPAAGDIALWCAFIGLFATQMTEQAIYARRNRTHPEAWARWATLEKFASKSDERSEALHLAFMAAVVGAMKMDEPFPEHLWPLLWKDQMLSVEEAVSPETLLRWDHLHCCPLDSLIADAEHSATRDGRMLLEALQGGDTPGALGQIVTSKRQLERMLDPNFALAFSTLRQAIDQAPSPLTEGDGVLFSVAGTRLAAQHLSGGDLDG